MFDSFHWFLRKLRSNGGPAFPKLINFHKKFQTLPHPLFLERKNAAIFLGKRAFPRHSCLVEKWKINLFTRKNHFNTFLPQIWYFLVPYQYQSTLLVHTGQSRILVVVIVGFQWFSVGFYWFSVPFSSFSISFSGFCSEYQCRLYIYEFLVVLGPHALYLITNKGLLVVAIGSF